MTETLRYGMTERGSLQLTVPRDIFSNALAESRISEILNRPERTVIHTESKGIDTLDFDLIPFRNVEEFDMEVAESYASQWLHTLVNIERATPNEARDPELYVRMDTVPQHDASFQQRRGLYAKFAWPLKDNVAASLAATDVMQNHATQFGYLDQSIAASAYATVNTSGAEFQALDIGCCCLGSNGDRYEVDETTLELHGHNLYNRQVVLTCLVGLVAAIRS